MEHSLAAHIDKMATKLHIDKKEKTEAEVNVTLILFSLARLTLCDFPLQFIAMRFWAIYYDIAAYCQWRFAAIFSSHCAFLSNGCVITVRYSERAVPRDAREGCLTLKVPEKLQLYGLYVYYVVHICDFGILRVKCPVDAH